MELFPAYIVHSVPGRARIRIPAKRGDGLFFANIESILQGCADVQTVQVNGRAGSVLITYGLGSNLKSIANYARRHRLFSLSSDQPAPLKTVREIFAAQLDRADRLLSSGSRGHLDSQSIFFLLFLGLGLLQMRRGRIMQPAIPLLWRAMEILRDIK